MGLKFTAITLLFTLANGFIVHPSRAKTTHLKSSAVPDFNAIEVAKTGGQGAVSASQKAVNQDLSLGAPRGRPGGGHFLTKGGIQVTANVEGLEFSKSLQTGTSEAAIDNLINRLDSHKGVLLASSYEFPGRYGRWSLGFLDPPIEISGKKDKCTIKALNERGKVLMPAIERAMKSLKDEKILSGIKILAPAESNGEAPAVTQIDVTVVPPAEVGTFNEEERSRQVSRKIRKLF
jgi:anthranilate synthase